MVPEVLLSSVLRTEAESDVSERVTASLLRPEMPLDA